MCVNFAICIKRENSEFLDLFLSSKITPISASALTSIVHTSYA
jgi:hypothetical protein